MVYKTLMLLVALGLVCAPSGAGAKDLCFRLGGGGNPSVLKVPPDYTMTTVNTCAALGGFEDAGIIDPGRYAGGRITASACVDEKGETLSIHSMYHNAYPIGSGEAYFETGLCAFDLAYGDGTIEKPYLGKCIGQVLGSPTPAGHTHGHFKQAGWLWLCDVPVPKAAVP